MNGARHKEIMSHAEVQFKHQWITLNEQHIGEMRESRFRARQTHNGGALLPAEAGCYVSHARALIIARAKCIAEAYTAFSEPAGREAEAEMSDFFTKTVAARRASFHSEAELRRIRTRDLSTQTQLSGLLGGFEREASPALLEAHAILDKQRIKVKNKPQPSAVSTKYVVDTSVFNWLTDSWIERDSLPSDGGFAVMHIQVDEINKTKDEERRARLLLTQASLHCELLPTETFLVDVSRLGHAKVGGGRLFMSLKAELDNLNKSKKNNSRDALIAEAAITNGYTLLTADGDLRSAVEKHGGKVFLFERRG